MVAKGKINWHKDAKRCYGCRQQTTDCLLCEWGALKELQPSTTGECISNTPKERETKSISFRSKVMVCGQAGWRGCASKVFQARADILIWAWCRRKKLLRILETCLPFGDRKRVVKGMHLTLFLPHAEYHCVLSLFLLNFPAVWLYRCVKPRRLWGVAT